MATGDKRGSLRLVWSYWWGVSLSVLGIITHTFYNVKNITNKLKTVGDGLNLRNSSTEEAQVRKKQLAWHEGCHHGKELRVKKKKLEIIHLGTRNKSLTVFWNNWCKEEPRGTRSSQVTVNQKCDATMKGNTVVVCVVWGVSSQSRGVLLLVWDTDYVGFFFQILCSI